MIKSCGEMLMYAKEKNPVVVAFWDGRSPRTRNMIEQAENSEVDVHIVRCLTMKIDNAEGNNRRSYRG